MAQHPTARPKHLTLPAGYGDFLSEVKAHIRQRQYQALRAANKELLALYWWMGEAIQRRQTEHGWGKAVVETLAHDLQAEFPGRNGFSAQNLWLMRQVFTEYTEKPKLQPLVGEISWAKNLLIMARCKDDLEREFYLRATARQLRRPTAQRRGHCCTLAGLGRWLGGNRLIARSGPKPKLLQCPP